MRTPLLAVSALPKRGRRPDGAIHRRRPVLESLEKRSLLSTFNEFPVAIPANPGYAGVLAITSGPDGNLWFTELFPNKIGRITPTGSLTEFALPNANAQPAGITLGPDGNLWFTESAATPVDPNHSANHIGRITPNGQISEFQIPSPFCEPLSITVGPDGNLWFTEYYGDYRNGDKIGRITPAGIITEFNVPTATSGPNAITAGADGNLWFTELLGNKIGRLTTNGAFTEFTLPAGNSQPTGITRGPDGNVWFTEYGPGYLGRITPGGTITEFPYYGYGPPTSLTTGPDGDLWVVETNGAIAQYTTSGLATLYVIPTANAQPQGITTGPDNHIWFTEYVASKVSELVALPTSVSLSAPAVSAGANGHVAVTVTSPSQTPTGNVSITIDGKTYSASLSNGTANIDVGSLPAGSYEVSANFADQGIYQASSASGILQVNPTTSSSTNVTEYAVPLSPAGTSSGVSTLTTGFDGNLWFAELVEGKIGRMTPDGAVSLFALPYANSQPFIITAGPDGNVWFAESAATPTLANRVANKIGRITPDGTITEFPIPSTFCEPLGMATGADGNLWFTEYATDKIGRVTTGGQFAEFPVPTNGALPYSIAAGPDGNLWFTEFSGNRIGRITPDGTITEFPISRGNTQPLGITLGPDGNLWFTEYSGQAVGRITPAGVVTEFPNGSYGGGLEITSGPDGNLWLTQVTGNYVVRVTTSGQATFFSVPSPNANPIGITVGPDEAIWFTEYASNKIGRISELPTSIALSAPTVTYGSHGQVTVNVKSTLGSGMPSGSVILTVDSTTFTASLNGGAATFDVGALGAGDHALAASFAFHGAFQSSSASGTLHVAPAQLQVTAVNLFMGHSDPVPTLAYKISGFVNGDSASVVTGSPDLSTTATSSSPVGNYPITVAQGTLSAANYAFALTGATLVVQPKVLDVRVDYGSKSMSLLGLKRDLPFANIQAIDVLFSDNVSVDQSALSLVGLNIPRYQFGRWSYNPSTHDATWTLSAPLAADRLLLSLAGATYAGDATIAVNSLTTTLAALPGDFNGDGVVNSQDLVGVRNAMLKFGDPSMIVWADLDGSGVVDLSDYDLVRRNIGKHLP